ncbi:MAG TPA: hypothetical protein VHV55_14675 [Pirellulales bacterium]|nr:hypothetical protein [Pirellulales bacterium]
MIRADTFAHTSAGTSLPMAIAAAISDYRDDNPTQFHPRRAPTLVATSRDHTEERLLEAAKMAGAISPEQVRELIRFDVHVRVHDGGSSPAAAIAASIVHAKKTSPNLFEPAA